MSEHRATISWNRDSEDFSYQAYSRNHTWEFENGIKIDASAAQDFLGTPENLDPEEAYVAALSSCHMLTFLAIAARQRWPAMIQVVIQLSQHAGGRFVLIR